MNQDFQQQHQNNYKRALLESIKNNTKALVEDDISSFIQKPPLDSMDSIQKKFLDCAKKNHIVLDSKGLNEMIQDYRKELWKVSSRIQKMREEELSNLIENHNFEKKKNLFVLYKKDLSNINKEMKKLMKEQLQSSYEKIIQKDIPKIFPKEIDMIIQNKFILDIAKFFEKTFEKQVLENFDIKVLVKDTTLMNLIKEQGERYSFTLKHSHLLESVHNHIDS